MKIKEPPTLLFSLGTLLLCIATYGTARNTSCTNAITWTTHAMYAGLFVVFVGLLTFFRKEKRSWPKTIIFSILASLGIAVLFIIINVAVQPGGIYHCYAF